MPTHMIEHLDLYEQGGAILFQGIPFDDVAFNVFKGEPGLRYLAKKVVQIRPDPLSETELVAMFRTRLQPVQSEHTKLKAPQLMALFCNECMWFAAWYLGFSYAIIPTVAAPIFHLLVYFVA